MLCCDAGFDLIPGLLLSHCHITTVSDGKA
jgi:hypothetical protein